MTAVTAASAADLGSLTVFSTLGEPLRAQLEIREVNAAASPKVRLAPASVYTRVGKQAVVPVSDMTVQLQSKDPYVVSIKSHAAVTESAFPLIVELSEDGKRSAKLYNVVLKPAALAKAERKAAQAKAELAAAASGVPSVQSAVPKIQQAAPKPAAAPAQQPAPKASTTRTATKPAAVKQPDSEMALNEKIKVESGMTMWSIAKRYKQNYPDAKMDQILVAFVRDNPKCFDAGRVNGVRVGSVLRAPKVSTVNQVALDEAWALVRVNPNADARKPASQRDLSRAQQRMKKQAPSLYQQLQANKAEKKTQARAQQPRESQPKAPVTAPRQERPAPTPASEPIAPAAQPTNAAPQQAAASSVQTTAPAADPLAATIAATAAADAVHSATKPEPKSEPAAAQQPEQPQAQTPVVNTEAEQSSNLSTYLIGLIVALMAAIAAAVLYLRQKQMRRRQQADAALKTVRFMKSQAPSEEQLEAASQLVANRIEADKAAARGFVKPQASASAAAPTAAQTAPNAAPTAGFNVGKAYVDEASGPVRDTILADQMINTARTYMGVGAHDQAVRPLNEAIAVGDEQQQATARELLAQVQARKAQ